MSNTITTPRFPTVRIHEPLYGDVVHSDDENEYEEEQSVSESDTSSVNAYSVDDVPSAAEGASVQHLPSEEVDFAREIEDDHIDDQTLEERVFGPEVESKTMRFRNWFITYFSNNWQPNFRNWPLVLFGVSTKEVCPQTGRVHYHCYIELSNPASFQTVQSKLDCPNAHCKPRLGTKRQAIAYCSKERTRFPGSEPVFYGEMSKQGQRTDLDWINEAVAQGATKYELLKIGGGNVLRYLNMINMAQKVYNRHDEQDLASLARRNLAKQVNKDVSQVLTPSLEAIRSKRDELRVLPIEAADTALQHTLRMVSCSDADKQHRQELIKLDKVKAKEERKEKSTASASKAKTKVDPAKELFAFIEQKTYKKLTKVFVDRVIDRAATHLPKYIESLHKIQKEEGTKFSSYRESTQQLQVDMSNYFGTFFSRSFPEVPNAATHPLVVDAINEVFDDLLKEIYDSTYESHYQHIEEISHPPSAAASTA